MTARGAVTALLSLLLLFRANMARAQDTSNLMPPSPAPSPGAPRMYVPGMPAPPPPGPATAPASTPTTGANRGGYLIGESTDDSNDNDTATEGEMIPPGEVSRGGIYTVRAGDTLSSIAQQVFHSWRAWPKLWALNPEVTNPHWIYPGDVLRIAANAPAAAATTAEFVSAP